MTGACAWAASNPHVNMANPTAHVRASDLMWNGAKALNSLEPCAWALGASVLARYSFIDFHEQVN